MIEMDLSLDEMAGKHYLITSDGAFEGDVLDLAPVHLEMSNDGRLVSLLVEPVEIASVSGDYALADHTHDDRYSLLDHTHAVSNFGLFSAAYSGTSAATAATVVSVSVSGLLAAPSYFQVVRTNGLNVQSYGLSGGVIASTLHAVGSPCSWNNYNGSWSYAGGVLALLSQNRFINQVGYNYLLLVFA